MNSRDLINICYVTPRSHDDPHEIQRILKKGRVKNIAKYIEEPSTLLPTAIVVSLEEDVSVLESGDPAVKTIAFPDSKGKFAYVLDGQHRLEGFKHTGPIQFDLPVVALYGADEATRAKVFADINSKQETITDVQILELYYQIRDLSADETALMDVVHTLNSADDSPLKNRVKILDDQKGTWIKNTILKRFLTRAIEDSGLSVKSPSQQASIIKEYFKAIMETWPEGWQKRGKYGLAHSIGFEVMLGVFPPAKHRVDLNAGREYTKANFAQALEPLVAPMIDIELPDGSKTKIQFDWDKKKTNFLSNQRGRNGLITQFSRLLHAADEPAPD